MSDFLSRVRKGRLFQVLALYLGASWLILQVADALEDTLGLPDWVGGAAFLLLLAGLVVILATAWIQSHPLVDQRARAEEVPHAWEFDASDLQKAIRAGRLPHLTWARVLAGGGVVFLLLFGFAGLYVVIQDRGRSFTPAPLEAAALPGLAVMPFEVRGEGLDVWREGMVDLLSTNLDGVAGLRGIDSRTVIARWRERVGSGPADLDVVLETARSTGGRLALVGSAVRLGSQVRLSGDLYDLETGRNLGSPRAEGPADDLLALVDRFSVDVLRVVLEHEEFAAAGLGPLQDVSALSTSSLEAVQAYLEGEASFRAGDFAGAIDALERALAADSTFVLPLARLAAAYGWAEGIGSEGWQAYGERALAHVDRLPPREAAVVKAVQQARVGEPDGINALERLTQRYPDDPEIWYELGDSYIHGGAGQLVPFTEARRIFDRAIALDSSFAPAYIHPFEIALGRFDTLAAARYLEAYQRYSPAGSSYRESMEVTYRLVTRPDSVEEIVAGLPSDLVVPVRSRLTMGLGGSRALAALSDDALRRPTLPPRATLPSLHQARVNAHINLGRIDEALEHARELPAAQGVMSVYPVTWFGVPLERAVVDSLMAAVPFPVVRAVFAVDRGRWEEHRAVVAAARDSVAASLARGDSAMAVVGGAYNDAAVAYGTWRRNGAGAALEPMTAAFRGATAAGDPAWPIRVWLGLMMMELDRPAEALRYLASIEHEHAFALFAAAGAREDLGRTGEAAEAYGILHRLWADADPDRVPQVAAVQRALERLAAEGT